MDAEPTRARIRAIGPGPVHIISFAVENPGFTFVAGQYVHVTDPDGNRIPFSIATLPARLPALELHFQPTPGHPDSGRMAALLQGSHLLLTGVAGQTVLGRASHPSLLFVCAGSGLAQALAMIESIAVPSPANDAPAPEVTILWCCESRDACYTTGRFFGLGARTSKHLCVDPSRTGLTAPLRWLKARSPELRDSHDVFLCGSPGFVYAATDVLTDAGLANTQLHSDVFDYAPR